MEVSLEGPIPGCNRLQICGLFARFCRDLQSYPLDIVDAAMSPVQFETRHPPHISLHGSFAAPLLREANKGSVTAEGMDNHSYREALNSYMESLRPSGASPPH
jgi:hypothetical protein